jgi:hypothetical protein
MEGSAKISLAFRGLSCRRLTMHNRELSFNWFEGGQHASTAECDCHPLCPTALVDCSGARCLSIAPRSLHQPIHETSTSEEYNILRSFRSTTVSSIDSAVVEADTTSVLLRAESQTRRIKEERSVFRCIITINII